MAFYYGVPMKFHRLNQFILLPLDLIGYMGATALYLLTREQYIARIGRPVFAMYIAFFASLALLNLVAQVGFMRMRPFSYYAFLLYKSLQIATLFFICSYIYDLESIRNLLNEATAISGVIPLDIRTTALALKYYRLGYGISFMLNLAVLALVIFYYLKRRCVFNFTEKRDKQKSVKDPWMSCERYIPDEGVVLSPAEEKSLAERRMRGMLDDARQDKPSEEEADIYAQPK